MIDERKKMTLDDLRSLFPSAPDSRRRMSVKEQIRLSPTRKPYNFRHAKMRRKMAKASRRINRGKS